MAWNDPVSRAAGYVIPADEWNKNTVANPQALRDLVTGGTAGQVLTAAGGGDEATWASPSGQGDSDQIVIAVQVFS